jgi:hypothetical protein
MTRVLFIGAPVDAVRDTSLSVEERFAQTGHNTGNLLIGCSLRRQIACSSWAFGTDRNLATVDQEFDLIAIPAANFIFKGFDFGWLADFLERTTLPCLIVGLGAQLPSVHHQELDIPEGTKRFIKIIAERTRKIGVRGAFTAEVLAKLGVHNVTVTGCPSLYWSRTPHMRIDKTPYRKDLAISVNGSRNVTQHSYAPERAMEVESALLKLALHKGHDYVLQNEFPEMALLFRSEPMDDEIRYQLNSLSQRFGLGLSAEDYLTRIRERCRVFFSIEDWAAYIKTKQFSVGTRFHGNIIALLSGVPALVFAHDSRTTEMCRFMQIPHLPLEHAALLEDPERLYKDADYTEFTRNYTRLYRNYLAFLEENGIPHLLAAAD